MEVTFYKYHGAGNDFILFDNRSVTFQLDSEAIARLCDRRFGIGADGLMTLNLSSSHDFHLNYYNADGSLGSLCGNGSRCGVALAFRLQMIKEKTSFTAADGEHSAEIDPTTQQVALSMGDVYEINPHKDYIFIDTGSPHHIRWVKDLNQVDVAQEGKRLRYEVHGTSGANVNFVEQKSENTFAIRTYERGVEAETLACGTGAVAAAIAMHYSHKTTAYSIEMQALGGLLKIDFTPINSGYTQIVLTGPAQFVFKGNLEL